MKVKDLIKELSKFPGDFEIEYHEDYYEADNFIFEEHKEKKATIVMMGKWC